MAMTDRQLVRHAREFRDGILDGDPSTSMCFAICAPLAGLLKFYGVEVELVEGMNDIGNHVWLRLPDGRVLDPTADQYNGVHGATFPPVYLGEPTRFHRNEKPAHHELLQKFVNRRRRKSELSG